MKLKTTLLALISTAVVSEGVTLNLSGAQGLTQVQNAAGAPAALAWGILVDTAGNGFSSLSGLSTTLSTNAQVDDDVLVMNSLTSVAANGLLTSFAFNFGDLPAVSGGETYAVVWFDGVSNGSDLSSEAGTYGITTATGVLPASNAATINPSEFVGQNGPATLQIGVIPEPSVAILGALGLLGLARRRR